MGCWAWSIEARVSSSRPVHQNNRYQRMVSSCINLLTILASITARKHQKSAPSCRSSTLVTAARLYICGNGQLGRACYSRASRRRNGAPEKAIAHHRMKSGESYRVGPKWRHGNIDKAKAAKAKRHHRQLWNICF